MKDNVIGGGEERIVEDYSANITAGWTDKGDEEMLEKLGSDKIRFVN